MSLLTVTDLSHCFIEKKLYDKAAFEIYKGEHIGVVGQNGVGKSTLINILMGEVIPDQGEIKWQRGIKVGHLNQYAETIKDMSIIDFLKLAYLDLYNKEKKMLCLYEEGAAEHDEKKLIKASEIQEELDRLDFYDIDNKINRIVIGLGINAYGLDKILDNLSGGQRAKVILAKLLLEELDVLLLDEPTNFLDKEHVEWLMQYLNSYNGAFIVVSHDYDFLDKISSGILNIEFTAIKKYSGKYSEFAKQKEFLRADYVTRYTKQKEMIERTEEFIRRNIAGVNTRMAQGRRKQLSRLERIAPPQFAAKPNFRFKEVPLSANKALTVKSLEIGYDTILLPKLDFTLLNGEKLAISGFNGIGKSTLLKTLIGQLKPINGEYTFGVGVKIGYYEQNLNWANDRLTPITYIQEVYPKLSLKEVRRSLSACGVKDAHAIQELKTLSGGEQSKVKLCKLILTPCNFLILDEPTNHFDVESKDVLKEAIDSFMGNVILVSHEQSFYNSIVDSYLNIEDLIV